MEAARRLLDQGQGLAIAAVAEEADVSRATAYRYFPSEQALVMELQLEIELPRMHSILDEARGGPSERVAHLQRIFHEHATRNEATFRHFLKAAHEVRLQAREDGESPRGGRRLEALEEVLVPLRGRLDDGTLETLRYSLAALIGIDAFVVMRDVCGLDARQAGAVGEWAVRTLIEGALARVVP